VQFLTIRERKSGTEKHMRQFGGQGEYFVFGYEVSHDPSLESVGVQLGRDVQSDHAREYGPDILAGVLAGLEEAQRKGVRLCCTRLLIPSIRDFPVDTSLRLVRARLAEFVLSRLTEWAEPVEPLRRAWLTSDVVALAKGIHATAALDGIPALTDALLEAGCDDPLVMEHLRTCPDHGPSCWVVEMILASL
jgi:hypothetical protein